MSARRPKRILVRATNWIGDGVMSMPAVQRLRELEPHAQIALLCPAKIAELWARNPYVNEVIGFTEDEADPRLRQREFDYGIIFPNSFRSAWEMFRARIPVRIGYPGHSRRWLLTEVVPEPAVDIPERRTLQVAGKEFEVKCWPQPRHQVQHYLDLIGHIGGNREYAVPRIYIANEELPHLTKFFHDDGLPCIGINAGAEYGPAKRWMPERFAEVAIRISEHHDCRWILFGGPGDVMIARHIERQLQAANIPTKEIVNAAGQTSLFELFLLLKMCVVLLTNDTGPMHVAYALGTPLVALFGSTSPALTGPLGPNSVVVQEPVECNPCFLRDCPIDFRCMNRISVDRVAEEVLKLCRTPVQPETTRGASRRLRVGWHFAK